ncbi:unnamed protein product [Pocillopora meandrina]|uniref:Fibrinogen C-terminal domain-containing protein n=1 Tax=Pocillopora meandrina TaxID=46732 RepID=A0AAU9XQP5_9CNID|nr:unnamed protein product [Pocillopora meandrina]
MSIPTSLKALLGSVPSRAAESCQHVIQNGDSTGKGERWIDPQSNGNPFKAFCEMTTDGGGWMILLNVVGKNRLYNYAAFVIYTDQQRPVNWRLLESHKRMPSVKGSYRQY